MKNLFFLSIILLISCNEKNANFGDVKIDDDKSIMIQKVFESVENEEINTLNKYSLKTLNLLTLMEIF